MCGRFTLVHTADDLNRIFHVRVPELAYQLSFNVAPGQECPVVVGGKAHHMRTMRWGLIPHWSKDASAGHRMINARAETAREKPAFRMPYRRRRCVVPASGFYEWQKTEAGKIPHYITAVDCSVLPFAGLWDRWDQDRDTVIETFTILTTTPNEEVAPVHDRMPVILAPDRWEAWLKTPEEKLDDLMPMLAPAPAGKLRLFPVSRRVNSPGNNDADLIRPVSDGPSGEIPPEATPPGHTPDLF